MAKRSWKPGTFVYPLPAVLASCGTMEQPNALTIAWTGIVCSDPAMTYISVRPSRYSYDLIKESGEFVINLTTRDLAYATDYMGVRSGRDENKFDTMKLTPEKAVHVSCPMIAESPVSIECKVTQVLPLGTHDMFLAEILAVNVDEKYFDDKDRFQMEQCDLLAFSHGQYYTLGEQIGKFGYSVAKKKPKKKRKSKSKSQT